MIRYCNFVGVMIVLFLVWGGFLTAAAWFDGSLGREWHSSHKFSKALGGRLRKPAKTLTNSKQNRTPGQRQSTGLPLIACANFKH